MISIREQFAEIDSLDQLLQFKKNLFARKTTYKIISGKPQTIVEKAMIDYCTPEQERVINKQLEKLKSALMKQIRKEYKNEDKD